MPDEGPPQGSEANREEGKTKRGGRCLKQGKEVWRHHFPDFVSYASPGFGVSACPQCLP